MATFSSELQVLIDHTIHYGEPKTEQQFRSFAEEQGFVLPKQYMQMMASHNGGTPHDYYPCAVERPDFYFLWLLTQISAEQAANPEEHEQDEVVETNEEEYEYNAGWPFPDWDKYKRKLHEHHIKGFPFAVDYNATEVWYFTTDQRIHSINLEAENPEPVFRHASFDIFVKSFKPEVNVAFELYLKSEALHKQNEHLQAIEKLLESWKESNHAATAHLLGICHSLLGKAEEAGQWFLQAHLDNPRHCKYATAWAQWLLDQGRRNEGIAMLEYILEVQKTYGPAAKLLKKLQSENDA